MSKVIIKYDGEVKEINGVTLKDAYEEAKVFIAENSINDLEWEIEE